jgi:Uma2 family endonuclease
MSTALKTNLTTEEFLPWAEAEGGRWELHDGKATMMSPERVAHNETKGEVYSALKDAVRRAKLPCTVYVDGMAIRVDARTTYEPDALVYCGPRPASDALAIDAPKIVVEVHSPSTAALDHGRKLSDYFSLPSVEHYLILDPDRRVAIHHKRAAEGAIETRVLADGRLRFDPPGFEVAVTDLFAAIPPAER